MPWGVTADTDQNKSVMASGASDGAQTSPGAEQMGQVVTAEMHQDGNITIWQFMEFAQEHHPTAAGQVGTSSTIE